MKLSKIAKSPLTYIAIAVAITAFAAGLFASAQTPALVADPDKVERTVVPAKVGRLNPDGTFTWTDVPAPPTGQSDDYDPILEPDATGIETMGKLLYLVDGGRIQLPPDVYVADFWTGGTCLDWTNCPEFPYVVLARGDDRVEIDRWGKPFTTWSVSSESDPSIESFEFLSSE